MMEASRGYGLERTVRWLGWWGQHWKYMIIWLLMKTPGKPKTYRTGFLFKQVNIFAFLRNLSGSKESKLKEYL